MPNVGARINDCHFIAHHVCADTEPAFAVALYSFTTAGLIATSLASGALSISSATLAAAGVLASQTSGSISADPSRNLLVRFTSSLPGFSAERIWSRECLMRNVVLGTIFVTS